MVVTGSPRARAAGALCGGEVSDDHIAEHCPIVAAAFRAGQIPVEDGAECVPVGHAEDAESADHHVEIHGVDIADEGPGALAALEDPGD